LHDPRDLHDPLAAFAGIPEARPDAEMIKLALQLVDRQTGRFDPADMTDRYEARLRELIDAKLQGEGLSRNTEPDEDRGNVVDLMAALKQSLGGDGRKVATPAKAVAQTTAAAAKKMPARSRKSAAKPARQRT
jgi:DNA end-binding protein Ku